MKVFVTGGTGFLGGAVVDGLVAAGHEVSALSRSSQNLRASVHTVHGHLDNIAEWSDRLKGHDVLVHLAGKVSRDPQDAAELYRIHVEATRQLLHAAVTTKVPKILLASTSGTIAVSKNSGPPMNEESSAPIEIIGKWPYYMSKNLQEREVLAWHHQGKVAALVLNPSLILGPGDERLSSTEDVLRVLHRRVPFFSDGTVAMVDVRDVARAFVHALALPFQGQRYLLNAANFSVRNFVERIAAAGGVPAPKFALRGDWAYQGARWLEGLSRSLRMTPQMDAMSADLSRHHWACDSSRAVQDLDFQPRDPQSTLTDTVRYLEQKGLFRRSA